METKKKKTVKQRFPSFFLAIILVIHFFAFPLLSQAAILGLSSSASQVTIGNTFTLRLAVNTLDKTINNAEAVIKFPTDLVEVVSVSSGGSIFSLWVEVPKFSNADGTISFNGGVPNPGYKGNGAILSAVVRAKKVGTATFSLGSAAVRENDGLGTNILAGQNGTSVKIIEEKKEEVPAEPKEGEVFERVAITSPTHPDRTKWYKETRAIFNWRIPKGATASQTIFDRDPNITPSVLNRPAISSVTIKDIEDGIWYLHARFLLNNKWSPIYSHKIQIDTTPPSNLQALFGTNEEGRSIVTLTAIDKASQLDHYTLQIDNQAPILVPAVVGETVALLPVITAGNHQMTIIAFDKAGNSSSLTQDFSGPAEESIKITEYTEEIKDNEIIKISGVGPANTQIRISLVTQAGLTRYYFVQTNNTGDFVFTSESVVSGLYTARAEVEDGQGGIRLSSVPVNITVKASLASKSIEAIAEVKKFLSLSMIAIILLLIIAGLGWFKYFSLRRRIFGKLGDQKSLKNLSKIISKKLMK